MTSIETVVDEASGDGDADIELSVVVPTYNEAENLPVLLGLLAEALADIRYEIIVVDDNSPDLTWEIAENWPDARVSTIRRVDTRGLSSAILTGMQAGRGKYIAVLDADMQHDERILPELFSKCVQGADISVGSRRAAGGGYGEWSRARRVVSWVATKMAGIAVPLVATDPMSGFFVVSRQYLREVEGQVNPRGFKILLELLARGRPRIEEVGYQFRTRQHGETKLTGGVMLEYLMALLHLRFGPVFSADLMRFAAVGAAGMLVNLFGYLVGRLLGLPVIWAFFAGVELSLLFNFLANSAYTFSTRVASAAFFVKGFALYQAVSVYAIMIQFAVFELLRHWWPFRSLDHGGLVLANACAIVLASVGNYTLHTRFTWRLLRKMKG